MYGNGTPESDIQSRVSSKSMACMRYTKARRTVIAQEPAGGGIVILCDDLPGSLRAQPRTITVVVHKWNLLRGLVRRVEVILV